MKVLQDTVEFHCQVSKELIRAEKKASFLHEYHKRWSAFVAAAIKLDEVLAPVSYCVNSCHDTLFPGFPSQPAFNAWRFCVKIWQREVFQPLRQKLERSAFEIVDRYTEATLLYGL